MLPPDPEEVRRTVEELLSRGRIDDAERETAAALAAGESAPVLHAAAAVRLRRGDRAAAQTAYRRALALDPDYARSANNLANLILEGPSPDLDAALALYERAVTSPGATANMRLNLARCLLRAKRVTEARAAFEASIARDGPSPKGFVGLAQALRAEGKERDASGVLAAAADVFPDDPGVLAERGSVLLALEDAAGALLSLRRARDRLGDAAPTVLLVQLAKALRAVGSLSAARTALDALAARPDLSAEAFEARAELALEQGRMAEAAGAYARSADLSTDEARLRLLGSRIFALAHDDACDVASLGAAATALDDAIARAYGVVQPASRLSPPSRPPRSVGFFSGDFRQHVVMRFLLPLLEAFRNGGLEVVLFSVAASADRQTQELARSFRFLDLAEHTRDEARDRICRSGIDVLIDLGAHTSGRFELLAPKLLPVQAHYLGFPGPVGSASVDYRVSDALAEPGGDVDVDRLLLLDRCAWVYRPPVVTPVSRTSARGPRFGCFARASKVSASTTSAWSELLLRSQDATLAVSGLAYQDADTFAELLSRLDPKVRGRVRLLPWARSDAEVHERHAEVDVILDTFPYQGTTTTCDAFAAGRPVVSLRWPTPAGRVASSLLASAGIPDLVATTPGGYVEKAAALAEDARRLRELDDALPAALREGPLGDPDGLAESFLRALTTAATEER